MHDRPLVSVVTPVYNGGKYLDACIQSVRQQRYDRIEHVILDNASSDDTAAIADAHAREDARIRVFRNPATVPVIENWNRANALMSPGSVYCKTLHADDLLYPQCIARMVELAERHRGVGIVGSLRMRGQHVQCGGLPIGQEVFPGIQVARLFMSGEVFAFAPTSGMVRTELVRSRKPFFPDRYLHADLAAYFDLLDGTEFGFIDEVLSFSRTHDQSITTTVAERQQTLLREGLVMLHEYGPRYFAAAELRELERRHLRRYYRVLVRTAATRPSRAFFRYHLEGLRQVGRAPSAAQLITAVLSEVRAGMARPGRVFDHLRHTLRG